MIVIPVTWDENALDRHEAWALQIALDFGLPSAKTYLVEIDSIQETIAEFPLIGTEFDSPGHLHLRRIVTTSGYSVFYELDSMEQPTEANIVSIIRGQEQQP